MNKTHEQIFKKKNDDNKLRAMKTNVLKIGPIQSIQPGLGTKIGLVRHIKPLIKNPP